MSVLTVADVLAMPAVRTAGPEVLAGRYALSRTVRWVHSAELADIAPLLREGDLLLSTGIAMPESAAGLQSYAASLSESRAAGLVIELGRRWAAVPPSLVDACEALDLPLVALRREVRFAAVAQAVGEYLVDSQVAEFRAAKQVHETFTDLSIAEAGPREILEAVQRLSASAVILESEQHQVLDYRAGLEDAAELLADWTSRSRGVVVQHRTSWDERNGWLVTRVGRRDRGWGRLVVLTEEQPTERLIALIERAAAALAMHRLHAGQRDTVVRRTHHELLIGLLSDPANPELAQRCEVAGVPIAVRQLVGLTLRPQIAEPSGVRGATMVEEVVAATVHAAHELKVPALVCEVEHDVRALLSFAPTVSAERTVSELARRVRRRHRVIIAAGRPVPGPAEADRTLKEAQHVIDSIGPHDLPDVVLRLEDVHLRGLLTMLAGDDRVTMFVDRELAALKAHDQAHNTNLVKVTRALVTHPRSKSEAAQALHLSRAVFYDRLTRVEQVIGAHLDDPDIRVSLHVALLIDEMRAEA